MAQGFIFKTVDQLGGGFDGELADENNISGYGDWYARARRIRLDPTIALSRAILAAPIIKNKWRVEGRDKSACELIERVLFPHRQELMRAAVFSAIDYGWQSWEVIPWKVDNTVHIRYKLLRHENTILKIDKDGFPDGLRNFPVNLSQFSSTHAAHVDVPRNRVALCAGQDEYGNPYGQAVLKNVEETMKRYDSVEWGAQRYVERVAGTHWVLYYPVGVSEYNGKTVPNSDIADNILSNLKASSQIAIPLTMANVSQMLTGKQNNDASKSAWQLEMITSQDGLDPFLERQRYLDALKMRGMFQPERTALEGQHGTKSESESQTEVSVVAIEQWGENIVNWFNSPYGFVARVLDFNNIEYYPGRVQVIPLPLADDDKRFIREVLRTLVNNIKHWGVEVIDIEEAAIRSGLPSNPNIKNLAEKIEKSSLNKSNQQQKDIEQPPGRPK